MKTKKKTKKKTRMMEVPKKCSLCGNDIIINVKMDGPYIIIDEEKNIICIFCRMEKIIELSKNKIPNQDIKYSSKWRFK